MQTQADLIVLTNIFSLPGFKVCYIPSCSEETWRGYNMNSLKCLEGSGLYFPPLGSANCQLLSHPVRHRRSARGSNPITCGTQCILELLQLLKGLPMVHTISSQREWARPKVKTEAKNVWCSMQCTDAKVEPTLEDRGTPKGANRASSASLKGSWELTALSGRSSALRALKLLENYDNCDFAALGLTCSTRIG